MKIQIKPVYYSEFFPNRKKQPLYPITRDFGIAPTQYSSFGKKLQVFEYSRKQLAEKVAKKLSISVDEVMTTYKDKIETAYWKNIDECIKAHIIDYGLFGHRNLKDRNPDHTTQQNEWNGFKSVNNMIPTPYSTYKVIQEELVNINGDWVWGHYQYSLSEDQHWYRNRTDEEKSYMYVRRDMNKRMSELEYIDVEFYDLNGKIIKHKKVYLRPSE